VAGSAGADRAREQRLVFGEVADAYDRVRPTYPEPLFDAVARFAALGPGDRVLEVGCGTGRATVPLARRGLTVLGLEPSADMAAVARRHCAAFPAVRIDTTTFEAWPVERHAFRLLVSAQAWHWVAPAARATKAHDALAPGGVLALCWNRVRWRADDPVRAALDATYDRLSPTLAARRPGFPGLGAAPAPPPSVVELEASGRFGPVRRHEYPWHARYRADRYVELLSTQSDHRMLPEPERRALLDGVAAVVAAAGGEIRVDYVAELYVTRRA
jgi:SAM-dependent methyltransferase